MNMSWPELDPYIQNEMPSRVDQSCESHFPRHR